jgi:hypothetical protein
MLFAMISAILVIAAAGIPQPASALEPVVFDFEDPTSPLNEQWVKSPIDPGGRGVTYSKERAKSGEQSLRVEGALPDGFGLTYYPWRDWTGYETLSFDLWVPPTVPRGEKSFDCWVYLKDSSYYWFETPVYAEATHPRQTWKLGAF